MNKQIEEMAKIVGDCRDVDDKTCEKYPTCAECKASRCYNAGYRKSTDVAKEIFANVEKVIRKHYKLPQYNLMCDIYKLKKKYESEGAE